MTTNGGTIDRVLRAALGIVLLYLAFFSGLPAFVEPLFKYGAAIATLRNSATWRIVAWPPSTT